MIVYFLFEDGVSIQELKKIKGALIVIDRAELVLPMDTIEYIRSDKSNDYLIFSRCCLFNNLSPNYYGGFVANNNEINMKYKYNEGGWF